MSNTDNPAESLNSQTLQALALDCWHRARGARMVPFAGHAMPLHYTGILAEHLWTRAQAGLFDVSHMGQLRIAGARAAAAIEALCPIDCATLAPGAQRYTLLLAEHGGILDDLIVTRWPDHWALVVNGATCSADIAHIAAHLGEGATLERVTDHGLLALQGPRAAEALRALAPIGEHGATIDDLGFMTAGRFDWLDARLVISRSGYTGEDGFEIAVPKAALEPLADALAAHPAVRPIGLGARDSLRLEAGLPLYGHDLTPAVDPVEAGLGFAIARSRRATGGFPGHARIAAALAQGPARCRIGLVLEGRMAAREGAQVYAGDRLAGTVTSGGFAPSLECPVALALVAADAADAALTIDLRGRRVPARVVPLPFVPHRYHRKGAAR